MKKLMILTLVAMFLSFGAEAKDKNLAKMAEKKRNEYLIIISKEMVMKHGPDYYRELATPVIKREAVTDYYTWLYEKYPGRIYYTVEYPYDDTEESFKMDYAAKTFIWEDTGIAFQISFGNGIGRTHLDDPAIWTGREVVARYIKQPSKKKPEHL